MSDSFGSEIHLPASNGVLKEIRVDGATGSMTYTYGRCVSCGEILNAPSDASVCLRGCTLCKRRECVHHFEGAPYCRAHFELEVITKRECMVAFCVAMGMEPRSAAKPCGMKKSEVNDAVAALVERKLMTVTNAIWKEHKLTDRGYAAMGVGTGVFKTETDFAIMLTMVGRDLLVV